MLINWCLGLDLCTCVRESGLGGVRIVDMKLYIYIYVLWGGEKRDVHENEKEKMCV